MAFTLLMSLPSGHTAGSGSLTIVLNQTRTVRQKLRRKAIHRRDKALPARATRSFSICAMSSSERPVNSITILRSKPCCSMVWAILSAALCSPLCSPSVSASARASARPFSMPFCSSCCAMVISLSSYCGTFCASLRTKVSASEVSPACSR
uniref:Uncharacterized protein n=1 Tax=Erwinia amylovora TaxID=552 RepID=Q9F804_ERWAM|nr:hypothetical protein [Erwinia amylovora]